MSSRIGLKPGLGRQRRASYTGRLLAFTTLATHLLGVSAVAPMKTRAAWAWWRSSASRQKRACCSCTCCWRRLTSWVCLRKARKAKMAVTMASAASTAVAMAVISPDRSTDMGKRMGCRACCPVVIVSGCPGGSSRGLHVFSTGFPHVLGGVRGGEGRGVREWGGCPLGWWHPASLLFLRAEGVVAVSVVPRRQGVRGVRRRRGG
jgi:hypothetical protein